MESSREILSNSGGGVFLGQNLARVTILGKQKARGLPWNAGIPKSRCRRATRTFQLPIAREDIGRSPGEWSTGENHRRLHQRSWRNAYGRSKDNRLARTIAVADP